MKRIWAFITNHTIRSVVPICLAAMLGGCAPAVQDTVTVGQTAERGSIRTDPAEEPEQTAAVTAKNLFESRNPYIGDAAATGRVVGLVKEYFGVKQDSTIELQTSYAPYGLILHFEEEADPVVMQRASAVLMGLIDNCCFVSWDYPFDEEGNRQYFYLPQGAVYGYVMDIAAVAGHDENDRESIADAKGSMDEVLDSMDEVLAGLEQMKDPWPAKQRAKTVDQAVAAAILEYNRYGYADGSEAYGEGHQILDTEVPEGEISPVTVYALTMYGGYQFQDGNFVKDSGSGVIPAVIRLTREPDGTFVAKEYQRPGDGGDYADSIKTMFPEALWERCISPSEDDMRSLTQQEQQYAEEYLQKIGREAVVGDYGDFPHTILTDLGVSVEVSNQMTEAGKYSEDAPSAHAPFWLGNIERLEDGERYEYEQAYDAEQQEIIFTKVRYETKEIIKREVYDSITGTLKSSN